MQIVIEANKEETLHMNGNYIIILYLKCIYVL